RDPEQSRQPVSQRGRQPNPARAGRSWLDWVTAASGTDRAEGRRSVPESGTNRAPLGYWLKEETHDFAAMGADRTPIVAGGRTTRLHRLVGGKRGSRSHLLLCLHRPVRGPARAGSDRIQD